MGLGVSPESSEDMHALQNYRINSSSSSLDSKHLAPAHLARYSPAAAVYYLSSYMLRTRQNRACCLVHFTINLLVILKLLRD